MTEPDDIELISAAKRGERGALNALFERVGPKLLALIRLRLGHRLRGHVESGDVMQQTLLNAFRNIDQFRGQRQGSMMAWLGGIARNEIRIYARHLERKQRDVRQNVPLDDVDQLVANQIRSEVSRIHLLDQTRVLEEALAQLSDTHREVIVLRRFEELSFAEVGQRLDKTADAARMLYARAMTALTLQMRRAEKKV